MIQRVLIIPFENFVVSNTPHQYVRSVGNKYHPMVLTGVKRLRQIVIHRLIITRKLKAAIHPYKVFPQAQITLRNLKASADFETKDLLTLGLNNQGGFLLEVPDDPRNWQVVEEFLQWLDNALANV